MPFFSIQGVIPNLLLVLIIISSFKFDLEIGLPLALLLAYIQTHFVYDGFFNLSWLLAPFFTIYLKPNWGFNSKIMIILQVVFITFYVELINSFFFSFSNGINVFVDNYWILLLSPVLNAILTIIAIFIFDRVFGLED